jgi:hypothetical protein
MRLSKPLVLLGILAVVGIGVIVAIRQTAGTFTETIQNGKRIINVGPRDSVQAAINAALKKAVASGPRPGGDEDELASPFKK